MSRSGQNLTNCTPVEKNNTLTIIFVNLTIMININKRLFFGIDKTKICIFLTLFLLAFRLHKQSQIDNN